MPTIAEELVRKKRVCAGHQALTTHMINKAGELLSQDAPDASSLSQLRLSLQEKLDVFKHLDGEILNLGNKGSVTEEIEQADEFKEDFYAVMVKIEHLLRSTHLRHDNTSLPDVDKFNCLRSLLQGPALDAASGLTLIAANYKEAVSILGTRAV